MFGLLLESICQPNQNGFGIRRSKERNPNRKPAREAGGDGDMRIAGNGGGGGNAPRGKIAALPGRPPLPAPPPRGKSAAGVPFSPKRRAPLWNPLTRLSPIA